jgi:hypothetical protein
MKGNLIFALRDIKKAFRYQKCWYSMTLAERRLVKNNKNFLSTRLGQTCVIVGAGPISGKEILPDYAIVSLNNAGLKTIKNIPVSYLVMLDSIYFSNTQFQFNDYANFDGSIPTLITSISNYRNIRDRAGVCMPVNQDLFIDSGSLPFLLNESKVHCMPSYTKLDQSIPRVANVMVLAIAAMIYLGFSRIILEGCQGNWASFNPNDSYEAKKRSFYRSDLAVPNISTKMNADRFTRDINLREWTSAFTMYDYVRYVYFCLECLAKEANEKGVYIENRTPNSYLDMF